MNCVFVVEGAWVLHPVEREWVPVVVKSRALVFESCCVDLIRSIPDETETLDWTHWSWPEEILMKIMVSLGGCPCFEAR